MFHVGEIPQTETHPGHTTRWIKSETPGRLFTNFRVECSCGFFSQDREGMDAEIEATTHLVESGVGGLGEVDRLFETVEVNGFFVIQHVGYTRVYPLSRGWATAVCAESAWARARVQTLPTRVLYRTGEEPKDLGLVFDPRQFEKSAYGGYVSAGIAMSDFYYAPIKFESWVSGFRSSPSLPEPEQAGLRPALETYKRALASALGR